MIKTKILSAHDKGSHAEVSVKIKKVLKSTKLKILRGKRTLYPESWTNRGCTCPILNPGKFDSLNCTSPPHTHRFHSRPSIPSYQWAEIAAQCWLKIIGCYITWIPTAISIKPKFHREKLGSSYRIWSIQFSLCSVVTAFGFTSLCSQRDGGAHHATIAWCIIQS